MSEQDRITESYPIQDVFADSMPRMERLGPCVRLLFTVTSAADYAGTPMQCIVAKIILPAEALQMIARQLANPHIDAMQSAQATLRELN
jgi:hypothetical protein